MDAIHLDKSMNIIFPGSYEEQRRIANGFKAISTAEFHYCTGHIDGLLVWNLRPNEKDAVVSEVGVKIIYYRRKRKFGLNLQGVCDLKGNSWTQALGILVLLLII